MKKRVVLFATILATSLCCFGVTNAAAKYKKEISLKSFDLNIIYDKPLIVTDAKSLAAAMASGKDLIIEGGTYTYMEGFANGINVTLHNIICKNYFVASSSSNIVINGLDGSSSSTPLLDIGSSATVTVNDAITGNNGAVASISGSATLIINGGTYARPYFIYSGRKTSTLIINGGTFTNVTSIDALVGDVGNVTIKGGTFGFDPSSSGYVAEGYEVVLNPDNTWKVQPKT